MSSTAAAAAGSHRKVDAELLCLQDEERSVCRHVLAAMCHASESLGQAIQRPGFMAAAAAKDAEAVPALCIFAMASREASPAQAQCKLSDFFSQLQPATTECLRSVHSGLAHRRFC